MIAMSLLLGMAQPAATDPYGLDGWFNCIAREREVFTRSKEPIQLLATATLAACTSAEDEMLAATIAQFRRNADPIQARKLAKDAVAETRARSHDALIEYFVRKRLPPG